VTFDNHKIGTKMCIMQRLASQESVLIELKCEKFAFKTCNQAC